MVWMRYAMLLAVPASYAAVDVVGSPPGNAAMSTTACYVALSNDITPLLDPKLPDIAASSAECASAAADSEAADRSADARRSAIAPGRRAAPQRVTPARIAGGSSERSGDPRSPSKPRSDGACNDDTNFVADLITQCLP